MTLGTARLPKPLSTEQAGALMVELVFDRNEGRVVDAATTLTLPGYSELIRSLLIGRRLDELEEAIDSLQQCFRGPLLRPTIAALTNALSNATCALQPVGRLS